MELAVVAARGVPPELLDKTELIRVWYDDLAGSLISRREPREPLGPDQAADGRFVEAVRQDLREEDGKPSETAVRMIWTGDHLDAARRLQTVITGPARAATAQRAASPLAG